MKRTTLRITSAITFVAMALFASTAIADDKKPNILVIWGDDIGIFNISAYSHGMMGYRTPSIDRLAREGAIFTDFYAEQSCTAGSSSFITGQIPFRTGLSKVGMPGARKGLSDRDPTLAELLKNHEYVSGQFGKNHLGDSSVNYIVYAWIDDANESIQRQSDLHEAVWWALKNRKITIAYPQLDMHLDQDMSDAVTSKR